uniref:Uncharacterized protein n=1 Tax=Tanacetum cinerariifolium TaxID=118510 RepID=A0A6L2JIH4_TANCI|nr:hypothetical protein [Tanacetum cinerariifolium]
MISGAMMNKEVRSLSLEVLKLRDEAENKKLKEDIAGLRELSSLVEFPRSSLRSMSRLSEARVRKACLLEAQAFEEVVSMNLDLLAYYSKRSLGLLKSLELNSLPIRKSSGAVPTFLFGAVHVDRRILRI